MDSLHVMGGDTLTLEWAEGDTLEFAVDAIIVLPDAGGGTGGAVDSVNGQVGPVVLNAADVGADSAGSAQAVRDALEPQIAANASGLASKADNLATSQALATKATTLQLNEVKALAEINELKLSTKAEQSDLDSLNATVTAQAQTLLTKANIATLTTLAQLVDTKADQAYVISEIARITGNAPAALDTLAEIAEQLGNDQTQINNLLNQIGNRVRFDASQSLTTTQQNQVLSNINAEKAGTATALIAAITPASIGAATTAQGTKADTAIQSADLAPVALSGSFSDLVNKSSLFNFVYSAYALGSDTAILATDTLGQMLGKLQSQISANTTALSTKVSSALLGAVNGIATLGSDGKLLAAQVPAVVPADKAWIDLTVQSGSGHVSGFADGSNKLQIAKENGYIYIRGVVRNTLGVSTSTLYANLSTAYMVKQLNQVSYIASPAVVINLNSTAAPVFLATYQTSATVQTISKSNNGAFEANGIFFIAPAVLGMAANP